ncbi:MAG: tetratricopeptide repeat protein [Magnetococcales bacterium]|nr:tetratricopeptide repeat protein [Magnetococcales bacterium]
MTTLPSDSLSRRRLLPILAVAGLVLALLGIYLQIVEFQPILLDDPSYRDNPFVQAGFSAESLQWALYGHVQVMSLWMPVTWLSLMLDQVLFGRDPGAMHGVNLFLFLAGVLALLLFLERAIGRFLTAWWITALVALHPLRVESVAWITERKDVLYFLFLMLTLAAWHRGVSRAPERPAQPARIWPALVCFLLALGSKPMAVTLPLLLLILDFWPLERWRTLGWRPLVEEKTPFILLAALVIIVDVRALDSHAQLAVIAWSDRLIDALAAIGSSLHLTLLPLDLIPHYQRYTMDSTLANALILVGVVGGITLAAGLLWRRWPPLAMGWAWFLITLLPTLGLVPATAPPIADRFTLLPHVGLFIPVVLGLTGLVRGRPRPAGGLALLGIGLLVIWSGLAWRQAGMWRDSVTLFRHAVQVAPHNPLMARFHCAALLDTNPQAALAALDQALALSPDDPRLLRYKGQALLLLKRPAAAQTPLEQAVAAQPGDSRTRLYLGAALLHQGQSRAAGEQFREAVRRALFKADLHLAIGDYHLEANDPDAAAEALRNAILLQPWHAKARRNLGRLLAGRDQPEAALPHLRQAVALAPRDPQAHYWLGRVYNRLQDYPKALAALERARALAPNHSAPLFETGYALLRLGQRTEAALWLQRTLERDPGHDLARRLLEVAQAPAPAPTGAAP